MSDGGSTPLFEVRALRCERGERLLFDKLDFCLGHGEVLQVVGPNGCGKTTMLRALAGLSTRCSGQMLWRGEPITAQRYEFLQQTLYLGHDAAVKPALSPLENLQWHAALWGSTRDTEPAQALGAFGLAHYLDTPAHRLSAGQQRRIALARLLLSPATLWLLDEPFTAIDHEGVTQLEKLIAAHAACGGAVLLTTHHELGIARRVLDLQPVACA